MKKSSDYTQIKYHTYDLVEFFVLLVGIVRKVVIQVILCDSVHYVVCHIQIYLLYYMKFHKRCLTPSLFNYI